MRDVEIGGKVCLGSGRPLAWIVGPGAGQDESRLAATAERLKKLSEKLDVPLVFKAGPGSESLEVPSRESRRELLFEKLAWIRSQFELPVLGEVESADDLEAAGQLLDVIQVPDFLCEQSLPLAAATATAPEAPASDSEQAMATITAAAGAAARPQGAGGCAPWPLRAGAGAAPPPFRPRGWF